MTGESAHRAREIRSWAEANLPAGDRARYFIAELATIVIEAAEPQRCAHGTPIERKADGSPVWRFCCDYEP